MSDEIHFRQSKVNEINKKCKEEEKKILINDFSYRRNEVQEYEIKMSPIEYSDYDKDVAIAKKYLDASNYIALNIYHRISDLKNTIKEVNEANLNLIDLPLSKEELDVFERKDEDIPDTIKEKFENIKDQIKTLENGINNVQEKLNEMDKDEDHQTYINLQNKQVDVMRYIKNLKFNVYDENKDN